jgi:nucleotide-binding universal stress UspA family protein
VTSYSCSLQLVSLAMIRFTEILCPVDLSDVSRRALDHARVLARWYGATLTVLEVAWAALPPSASPAAASSAVGAALLPASERDLLDQLEAFCGTEPDVRMKARVREGAVVPKILEEAHQIGADLIVMGTHGHSGFDRLLLGSIAEKTLHKAVCPVMTVPPTSPAPHQTAEPFKRIVCAMDFSPASFAALNHGLSLAQEADGALTVVHVLDEPPDRTIPSGLGPEVAADRRLHHSAALRELRLAVPDEARNWCQVDEVVRTGRPHEEVVALTGEAGADLVVVGVHGRTGLRRPFVGSTTNQIVRHAACPVLTVR